MKNTVLLTCFLLAITGIALLARAQEETAGGQLLQIMAAGEGRGEKDRPAEEAAGLAYFGLVAEQVFTLQTGAAPFEKLKEALLNL